MMKLSERIRNAGAGTFQDMWDEIADEAAKLLQAVNDKDQELFESQELVAELLEALENLVEDCEHNDPLPSTIALANKAIRKASQ